MSLFNPDKWVHYLGFLSRKPSDPAALHYPRPSAAQAGALASQNPIDANLSSISQELPLARILQICLVQISTAIAFVLIHSTLNRVMIVEFGVQAWLVGVLIGFHNLLAFVRPMIGYYSDSHLLFGYRRTPNILVGNLLVTTGVIGSIYGAVWMGQSFYGGLSVLILAAMLYGIGINIVGTMFYAMLADSVGEKHKAKAVTAGWFVLIMGTIVMSAFVGKYLENFSEERLISLFWMGGAASILFTWLAVFKAEKRFASREEIVRSGSKPLGLSNALKELFQNKSTYQFFLFMFVTVVAIQGQDVILEPFGAHIFGMSVSETTKLTQIWGAGTMVGIIALGLFFVNKLGKKQTAYLGCILSAVGFGVISASAWFDPAMFKTGVFMLGLGNGALTIGSLTLMVDMTTQRNAGLFMGLWGLAQALANFVANAFGGAIRDISLYLTNSQYVGYTTAFTIEIIGLFAAIWILKGISVQEFKKSSTDVLLETGNAAD
jgi:MFS transporter, BCD family, chlorophyll transporter